MIQSAIKISVIIPCYNASLTIAKCVESVINQTHSVFETIFVDDCSQDDTLETLKKLKEKYSQNNHFKIFSMSENSGPSAARNLGIQSAEGNWIAFLDSDDCWHKDKIEKQVSQIAQNKHFEIISCAFEKKKLPEKIEKKEITFKMLCLKNYFETPCVLVRKDVIENHLFDPKQKYAEDHNVWLEILLNHRALYLNEVLANNVFNKRPFGNSGLSANIWKMELGELSNFKSLFKRNKLSLAEYLLYSSFSFIKFIRRLVLSYLDKIN